MDQLLASLPKPLIAIVALVLGLLVIIRMNPPVTVCDSQLALFRDSQKNFLFPKGGGELQAPSRIDQVVRTCMNDNSPGGCFELFQGLKKMVVDMRNIPDQCIETAAEEPVIQKWVWTNLKLMVQSAWGEKPPASYLQKNGWFDASEITIYCDLKRAALRFYGQEKFAQWQEGMLTGMPKADKLTREQVWPRSILSVACDSFR